MSSLNNIVEVICIVMIFIGMFFMLTAALGVVRFKDLYTRLHAATKASTFGFAFLVIGASILLGDSTDLAKGIVAVLFQFFSAPIGAHMICRVALKKGIRPISDPQGSLLESKGPND